MKNWIKLSLAIVAIGAIFAGATMLAKIVLAPVAIVSKTLDADNVIANYEWFKRQYHEIEAFKSKLIISRKALDAARMFAKDNFEDRQELNRLGSIILGIETQLNDMIAQYNARAQMLNRDIFRTGDLPERIDPTAF